MNLIALIVLFATLAMCYGQAEYASVKERLMQYRQVQLDQQVLSLEAVREHHQRRLEKLEEMLEQRQQSLNDHRAGRRLLKDEEHKRVTHQIDIFQRKLDQMRGMTDEDHRETLETEARSFEQLKRIDYLDF